MAVCEVCGNEYDKSFTLKRANEDKAHVFDSFECAIHALAPRCAHCECRIVGHGVESESGIFCCAHCAKQEGAGDLRDRSNGTSRDDDVDRSVAASFPASDPPANY